MSFLPTKTMDYAMMEIISQSATMMEEIAVDVMQTSATAKNVPARTHLTKIMMVHLLSNFYC